MKNFFSQFKMSYKENITEAPYGYMFDKNHFLTINESEMEVLFYIKSCLTDKDKTLKYICKHLNNRNVLYRGSKWDIVNLYKLIMHLHYNDVFVFQYNRKKP